MLKTIDPLIGADLLFTLASMGHGDEIAIVDSNFPAAATARRLVHLRGADTPTALRAILTLLPLDEEVECPAAVMRVPDGTDPASTGAFEAAAIVESACGRRMRVAQIDRLEFYDRARNAFAVVATGERRLYGNVILVTGALRPAVPARHGE